MDKKRIIQALQELKNETYFQQSAENFQYVFILIYLVFYLKSILLLFNIKYHSSTKNLANGIIYICKFSSKQTCTIFIRNYKIIAM